MSRITVSHCFLGSGFGKNPKETKGGGERAGVGQMGLFSVTVGLWGQRDGQG